MKCEICFNNLKVIWSINRSIAPNQYKKNKNKLIKISKQQSLFCENCNYVKNKHDFKTKEIFDYYKYRSPKTNFDIPIVTYIKNFCEFNNVKSIVEIGGNNGVFAEKLISNMKKIDEYFIYDKIPIKKKEKLFHKNEFLSTKTKFRQSEMVIARHVFAHNQSIKEFANNIVKKFNPKYIYIECADWNFTFKNNDFSQLYAEHYYCLSVQSIVKLFSVYGYNIQKLLNLKIHNGSFGLILGKNISKSMSFKKNINALSVKNKIKNWCQKIKVTWKTISINPIVIWGSSAKIIFIINALNLKTKSIEIIHDSTVEKKNYYPPGLNVKISSEPSKINFGKYSIIVGAKNFKSIIVPKIKKIYLNSKIVNI